MKKILLVLLLFLAGCGKNPFFPEPDPMPFVPPQNYTVVFEVKIIPKNPAVVTSQKVKLNYEINYPCVEYYNGPGYAGNGVQYLIPAGPLNNYNEHAWKYSFTTTSGNSYDFKTGFVESSQDILMITIYKDGLVIRQMTDGGISKEIELVGKF